MLFKFIFIICVQFKVINGIWNGPGRLNNIPLIPNYLSMKREVKRRKNGNDRIKNNVIDNKAYKKVRYEVSLMDYMMEGKDRRERDFEAHTEIIREAQNLAQLNVILTYFATELLYQYTMFFFELLGALYLKVELEENLEKYMDTFQQKLLELFKISTVSIIDASPRSKIRLILNSIQYRVLVERLSQVANEFEIDREFDSLEEEIRSINEERLNKVGLWTVVHSEAFKKGLIILSRALIIATLNNIFVPLLFNLVTKMIPKDLPGYALLQYLIKSFNLSFN